MGAFVGAWRAGKSSGDAEGGGRVSIGGALANLTDLDVDAGFVAVSGGLGVVTGAIDWGALDRKNLKNLSFDSGNPSEAGKFSVAQKSLYAMVKVLKRARPSEDDMFGFEPVIHSKMW